MIKKLKITNFESWKNQEVTFTEGVNIITGSSDKGKSALKRSLNWCLLNNPVGNAFISHGEKICIVEVDDIKRIKTPSKNEYYLGDICFKAFGVEPPQEILDYHKMEEINWQNQHDSPFLLSKTAGEISRYLNEIVNLGVIDTSLKSINSEIVRNNQNLTNAIEHLESLQLDSKQYLNLPKLTKILNATKQKQFLLIKNKKLLLSLCELKESIEDINVKLMKNKADKANKVFKLLENNIVQKNLLNKKIDTIYSTIQQITNQELLLNDCISPKAERVVNSLIAKKNKVKSKKTTIQEIDRYIAEIKINENKIKELKTNIKNNIGKFPKHCPTCGNLFKGEQND